MAQAQLYRHAVRVGTFGFSLTQSLNSAIVFQNGAAGTVSGTVIPCQDNDAVPGTATGASFGVESVATLVVGDFAWTPSVFRGRTRWHMSMAWGRP